MSARQATIRWAYWRPNFPLPKNGRSLLLPVDRPLSAEYLAQYPIRSKGRTYECPVPLCDAKMDVRIQGRVPHFARRPGSQHNREVCGFDNEGDRDPDRAYQTMQLVNFFCDHADPQNRRIIKLSSAGLEGLFKGACGEAPGSNAQPEDGKIRFRDIGAFLRIGGYAPLAQNVYFEANGQLMAFGDVVMSGAYSRLYQEISCRGRSLPHLVSVAIKEGQQIKETPGKGLPFTLTCEVKPDQKTDSLFPHPCQPVLAASNAEVFNGITEDGVVVKPTVAWVVSPAHYKTSADIVVPDCIQERLDLSKDSVPLGLEVQSSSHIWASPAL